MKQQGEKLIFESGREIDPYCGFVGINEDGEISEGYDDTYTIGRKPYIYNSLSKQEASELAEFMIERWKKLIKK